MTFAPGRITGLIGPSGAGKSTLLALLAALREPDADVTCGGGELGGEAWWPRVGVARPAPALLRGPLRETLTLQVGARGTRGRAVDIALALSPRRGARRRRGARGRARHARRAGGRPLAGGQVQRLALAGALALATRRCCCSTSRPRTSIPAAAEHAAHGIREAARGRTAIIATHDPAVMAICDDIVELRAGRAAEAVAA